MYLWSLVVNLSNNKVLVSWSTGKDSAYALHKIRQTDSYEVVGILSTITEEYDRVSMHATRHELLKQQAAQLDLPVYPVFIPAICSNGIYAARMQWLLEQVRNQGVTHIVFGDLYLEDIRQYRESKLAVVGIKPIFPLWGSDTRQLAREMIDIGMKAVITCIDPRKLNHSFVGRQFDQQLLADLPENVDPCGENGEFHTFVYAGPMFSYPIAVSIGVAVERDGYLFADVLLKDDFCVSSER